MSNTITIELCAEDRTRLDKILEALTSRNCQDCANSVAKYVAAEVSHAAEEHPVVDPFPAPAPEPEAPTTPEPVEAPTTPEPVEEPEAEEAAPTVSQSDVQKLVVELSAAGKKDQVREIVTKYAARVSAIPEDKLAEVWNKLNELEG